MCKIICFFALVLLLPAVCLAVIYQTPVTKGPQRSSANVLTADLVLVEERQGKIDGPSKEKRVIAVYSGKPKPHRESTTPPPATSTTTLPTATASEPVFRSSRINSIDDNGCLIAVESPIYQPFIVHHARTPKKPSENVTMSTTRTQSPNVFSHARGAPPRPFVPATTSSTTTTTTTTEAPAIRIRTPYTPRCPKPNGLFPHEEDCSRFINCWRGTPHIQKCAHGTLFSPALGNCDHAAKVVCQTKRSGVLTTLAPSTTTTTRPPAVETRKAVSCPEPKGIFPYEGDCKKYIYCLKNRPQVQLCHEGTLFDPATKRCEDAQQVQCQVTPSVAKREGIGRSASARRLDVVPLNKTVSCPRRKGLFPFEGDCEKFINCWAGKAHVQTCAEGTLFNPLTLECDHAAKVKCLAVAATSDEELVDSADEFGDDTHHRSSAASSRRLDFERAPLSPDSGQRIRLRGGAGPWEGYVEVRANRDKPWGHVCDASDAWTVHDANVICRTLGFLRGAQKSVQGLEFGPVTLDRVLIEKVECSGSESNLTECKVYTGSNCRYINEQVVGVRCHRDPQSLCSPDEYAHGNACYKLIADQLVTRDTARSLCEANGGHLLQIFSQSENDFVSDLLSSLAPSVTKVHTDGVATKVMKNNWFVWETNLIAMNFTKWWPDWNRTRTGNPSPATSSECVLLRNRFEYENQCAVLPYFFWTLGDCGVAAAVVCKKAPRDIGCVFGNGADYQGTANVSQTGAACLMWSDPQIRHVQAKPSRAALVRSDAARAEIRITAGSSLKHNYCRNPHGEAKPWCFISPYEMEFCDIPKCPISSKPAALRDPTSSVQCKLNQYKCTSGECIPNTWVCDGSPDCEGGSDEDNCVQYMGEFDKRDNETLQNHDVEKWMHTTIETCARRCAEAKSFTCMSFNYNAGQSECILTSNNRGLTGDMIESLGWSYYERKIYSVKCTADHFECPTGKCINQTSVCDGINDCGDRADETVCRAELDFQIRLTGGNKTGEGRVEVKVFGQWGSVCDDSFGMNDANVICRQLGFTLGASEALSHSAFGPGSPILMDDVQCHGNETSLADCKFAGWGVHNCNPEETAGVRCNVPAATCSDEQWKCQSTDSCIAINFLCDTVDDCGDHSDENRTQCDSELLVRLADGPDFTSGRVEIRRNGVWGTICDDDFSVEDASVICRMMGLTGPAQVVSGGVFGPGRGPIWLDEVGCTGTETSLMECSRLPWAQHNCRHSEDVGIRCSKEDELITSRERPAENQIPDLVNSGTLPAQCGLRIADDNPLDPLGQPKIVKGQPTQPGAYPWQVGVRIKGSGRSDSSHWCGASIISEHFLITAAHCMEDFPKGLYVLRVGDYNTRDPDPEEEEFGIDRLYFHEEFGQGGHLNHDIALVRVKAKGNRGIRFGSHTQPICLPPPNAVYSAELNCTISGWGLPGQPGQEYAIRLQSAAVPLMADETCKAPHVYGPERIKSGMFCAGYIEGGVDSCQGDSGGGLVCLVDGRPTLMGVTSWGFGCGRPNRPGVYTRVVNYLPWIFSKLADKTL